MDFDDEEWLSICDAVHSAAFDAAGWPRALELLAAGTGSHMGELISVGPEGSIPLNLCTGVDTDFVRDFAACGGGDPAVNPRIAAGMRARPLQTITERDFITPAEIKRHPHYQEFAIPRGIAFLCASVLDRGEGTMIGLAVGRGADVGHVTSAQRRIFASLAPVVRSAVLLHRAFDGHGLSLLTGTMEGVGFSAYICDRDCRILALSPTAVEHAARCTGLRIRNGYLAARRHQDTQALAMRARAICCGWGSVGSARASQVVIRDAAGRPSVLSVIALPPLDGPFSATPRVLILAARPQAPKDIQTLLRVAFGLAPAESQVATLLADGATVEAIAEQRHVALVTVRAQVRAVFQKLGVRRQSGVAAVVNRLR